MTEMLYFILLQMSYLKMSVIDRNVYREDIFIVGTLCIYLHIHIYYEAINFLCHLCAYIH